MITTETLQRAAGAELVLALADDDGDGEADAGVLQHCIESATRAVLSETGRRGITSGALVEDLIVTHAVAALFERRREPMPQPWRDRLDRAQTIARQVGDGLHPLAPGSSTATRESSERAFDPPAVRRY